MAKQFHIINADHHAPDPSLTNEDRGTSHGWWYDEASGEFYAVTNILSQNQILYDPEPYILRLNRDKEIKKAVPGAIFAIWLMYFLVYSIFAIFQVLNDSIVRNGLLVLALIPAWLTFCFIFSPNNGHRLGPMPRKVTPLDDRKDYGNSGPAQSSQLNQRFGGTSAAQSGNRRFRD